MGSPVGYLSIYDASSSLLKSAASFFPAYVTHIRAYPHILIFLFVYTHLCIPLVSLFPSTSSQKVSLMEIFVSGILNALLWDVLNNCLNGSSFYGLFRNCLLHSGLTYAIFLVSCETQNEIYYFGPPLNNILIHSVRARNYKTDCYDELSRRVHSMCNRWSSIKLLLFTTRARFLSLFLANCALLKRFRKIQILTLLWRSVNLLRLKCQSTSSKVVNGWISDRRTEEIVISLEATDIIKKKPKKKYKDSDKNRFLEAEATSALGKIDWSFTSSAAHSLSFGKFQRRFANRRAITYSCDPPDSWGFGNGSHKAISRGTRDERAILARNSRSVSTGSPRTKSRRSRKTANLTPTWDSSEGRIPEEIRDLNFPRHTAGHFDVRVTARHRRGRPRKTC